MLAKRHETRVERVKLQGVEGRKVEGRKVEGEEGGGGDRKREGRGAMT